ncbi:MAG: hypothetical protein ACRDOO_26125 [Actinomadura sp.]
MHTVNPEIAHLLATQRLDALRAEADRDRLARTASRRRRRRLRASASSTRVATA